PNPVSTSLVCQISAHLQVPSPGLPAIACFPIGAHSPHFALRSKLVLPSPPELGPCLRPYASSPLRACLVKRIPPRLQAPPAHPRIQIKTIGAAFTDQVQSPTEQHNTHRI